MVMPLTLVAVLLVIVLVLLLVIVLRRYLLTGDLGSFDCSLRRERGGHSNTGRWMLGVARYGSDRLDWYRLFSMSPRPWRSFERARLMIVEQRRQASGEGYSVMPGAVIVRCAYGRLVLELAMTESAYTGLSTWLESAPPGPRTLLS
jgi:hypothetical protein